jgi:hypothetical protein
VRPETANEQHRERIGSEKHPVSMKNRVHTGQFASASVSIGNCSDVP